MFSIDKLKKNSANPLPNQEKDLLPEVNIIDNIKQKIDEVLAFRL